MCERRRKYIYVTEEQIRQAILELEWEENMDLEQEIAEANAWAEENHIVRPDFPELPELPYKKKSALYPLKPRRDTKTIQKKKRYFRSCLQLAAVFVMMILGGWYMQTDAVQGMRLDLMNLFTRKYLDKSVLELSEEVDWHGDYISSDLPAGFVLTDTQEYSTIRTQKYTVNGHWINVSQIRYKTSYIYQEPEITEIWVQNKFKANLLTQGDVWYVSWYDDHNIYILVEGNLEFREGISFINTLNWSQQ